MQAISGSIRRLRPYLGTFVEVAASGAGAAALEGGIEAAYAAIGTVHRLMSFHEETSDVSRLNRGAFEAAINVHPWTFQVLSAALDIHRCSSGLFDMRVAPALQKLGMLPFCEDDHASNATLVSSQGEIELLKDERVRFTHRATRIDLGGIAKGFAVDRAIEALRDHGISYGLVNAGGDLATYGPKGVMAAIRNPAEPHQDLCRITLRDAALASSGAAFDPVHSTETGRMAVLNPETGAPACAMAGATVRAPTCLLADALTKVVMVGGKSSAPLLRQYAASALFVAADGEVYVTPEWADAAVLAA